MVIVGISPHCYMWTYTHTVTSFSEQELNLRPPPEGGALPGAELPEIPPPPKRGSGPRGTRTPEPEGTGLQPVAIAALPPIHVPVSAGCHVYSRDEGFLCPHRAGQPVS